MHVPGDVQPVGGLGRHRDRRDLVQAVVCTAAVRHQRALGFIVPQRGGAQAVGTVVADCGEIYSRFV